ncbi:MAG: heavy metal-binding domain-containing protein, partial [Microgenomates group bacterium]
MMKYTCPMHPEVILDAPGKCPKCGMELVMQHEGQMKEPTLLRQDATE